MKLKSLFEVIQDDTKMFSTLIENAEGMLFDATIANQQDLFFDGEIMPEDKEYCEKLEALIEKLKQIRNNTHGTEELVNMLVKSI